MSKVIVMRGLPGVGKSTWVREYLATRRTEDCFGLINTVSADYFFKRELDGEYKFDATKLPDAHKWCMSQFLRYTNDELCEIVIVDNTNSQRWEYMPYVSVAESLGYEVEIVEVWPWELPVNYATLARNNVHNVPESTIKAMHKRWEEVLPWQKVTRIETGRPNND